MKGSAYQFVCACLRGDDNAARALTRGTSQDWDSVFRVATEERVLPLLNSCINQLELRSTLPPDVADFLSAVEDLNRERNRHLLREVKFAGRLLNEAGIEPVLLKGLAYLMMGVYPDPAARYLLDIDILISETQSRAAVEILNRNGFAADSNDHFGQFRHHHPPMRRPESPYIEVHHSLCLGKSSALLPPSDMIACSVPFDLDGVRVRVPCPEDLFTHLVVHSQILHTYSERIWPPLRAMSDLDRLLRRFRDVIDWSRIEKRFRKNGTFGLLALHFLQVSESLGVEPPFKFQMRGLMRLRLGRRRLVRRMPALRYVDPIYMLSTVFVGRMRVLRNMIGKPKGLKHLLKQLLTIGVYKRFATDVIEGRGR
jgi:hypothetical protein